MYKLKKDGVVRIVTTEAEAERWEGLGYKQEAAEPAAAQGNADPLASAGVDVLKEYAKAHDIDIGNATSQNGILKKIRDAEPLTPGGE